MYCGTATKKSSACFKVVGCFNTLKNEVIKLHKMFDFKYILLTQTAHALQDSSRS